jgi:NADPH:quinone reductase-like Zn-dependent oxidoreductase
VKALVQDRYGSPDVLRIDTAPKPDPGPGDVVVRVKAASVNARDWHLMRGEPRIVRLLDPKTFGRSAPKVRIRGTDFAGTVESVGDRVTRLRPGDEVFGESDAAIAEYVVASEHVVAAMPPGLTFEQAAALPLAANTALVCLRAGGAQAGRTVLINGASGGVGTFAVQLAKAMGMHVTAVCSGRNAELVRSLGADVVIDYGREDFRESGGSYDLVLDLVGNRSLRDFRRVLSPSGTLVLSGGGMSGDGRYIGPLSLMTRAKLVGALSRLRVVIPLAEPSAENLTELAELVKSGSLTPVVDRTFTFEDAPQAIRYLEVEHARAKVVVTVG